MEVCEEMIRGMPKCSKHERRHKGEKVGGLLSEFQFLSGGLTIGWWAFVPLPGQVYSNKTLTHSVSRQEPKPFSPRTLFNRNHSVRA